MGNCDGSGTGESINKENCEMVLSYIVSKTGITEFVDLGTGLGRLPFVAEKTGLAKVIGVEGSKDLYEQSLCKHLILNVDICDGNPGKKYALSTSFEVLEHIPRSFQPKFWKGIAAFADKHMCAIHTSGAEDEGHATIIDKSTWERFFRDNNIGFEYLYDFPLRKHRRPNSQFNMNSNWIWSEFWYLDLSKMAEDVVFNY